MSQTMLLTKRLTAFLSQNTTPQLPTLLLISPTGKLLASSSTIPASKLRTQSTLACTLWNLYQPVDHAEEEEHDAITNLLNEQDGGQNQSASNGNPTSNNSITGDHDKQRTVTIQLTDGVMVIRSLKCQLLFVAIGSPPTTTYPGSPQLRAQTQHLSSSSFGSPPTSPAPQQSEGQDNLTVAGYADKDGRRDALGSSYHGSTTASEVGSVTSTTRKIQANVLMVKRQADEVGKWLEINLEGFDLSPGEVR